MRDITLSVPAQSTLLIIGPNGAGKTTLLRLLATALRPSEGQVRIFGHDSAHDPEVMRSLIAFLGTAHGMYEALTAEENLAFAAAMSGRPIPAPGWLDQYGLARVAHHPVRTFSQGMKRRLALARVALLEPKVLFLDEPFTGLDRDGSRLIETLMAEVKARGGSVVLATHEWERGLQLADAVTALAGGRQIAASSASGLSAPAVRALAGGRT